MEIDPQTGEPYPPGPGAQALDRKQRQQLRESNHAAAAQLHSQSFQENDPTLAHAAKIVKG